MRVFSFDKCIFYFYKMNVLRSASVFPSYSKLKQQLQQKQCQAYEKVIARLGNRLSSMQKQHDFAGDHQRIKDCIIALSHQDNTDKPVIEKENLKWAHQRHASGTNIQESLNYFIEDDKEEENNYQTFLKFKKKALERDLEEDRFDRLSGKQKKKQQQEEEQLFKQLYNNQLYNHQQNHIPKQPPKQLKRGRQTKSRPFMTPRRSEEEGHLADYRQKMLYEKNKKLLTENYMDILKKLDNANIVKWRILNQNH